MLERPDHARRTKVDVALAIPDVLIVRMRRPELIPAEMVEGIGNDCIDRLDNSALVPGQGMQRHMARWFDHEDEGSPYASSPRASGHRSIAERAPINPRGFARAESSAPRRLRRR